MHLHTGRALSRYEIEELLAEARERTLLLTAGVSEEDLRRQHDPLMSPIVWDLGHIAHFEDVWLRRNVREGSTGSEGLSGVYDPFEHPRSVRDRLDLPGLAECRRFLGEVRRAVLQGLSEVPLDGGASRVDGQRGTDADRRLLDEGFVFRMVLQHEYQHNETILQTLQLKRGSPYAAPRLLAPPHPDPEAPEPGAMVRFPGGRVTIGTDDRSTAYDNERPAHEVELEPFWIDVHPVTNAAYREFVDDGGYGDREAWSDEGWAWKEEAGLEAPKYWTGAGAGWRERVMDRTLDLHPLRPVCHVCYWEAEAYARWAGKRLPTEAEWEAAAAWDSTAGRSLAYPWGDAPPTASRANLDALVFEPTVVGSYPEGRSPLGCWDMLGNVWEWTSSDFRGYPGYETFPYPEYSEAFFGTEFKVLRGGSWATRFGAIRNTFRNWDYPIRRQIFSGFRCAKDDR
ncbi:MAG: ergothioneine biosynthesis protein EgtB [Longimicrobiales bacterium]|nr:ergothioneine biosynthesis protein EgtB [Longimicrobiales bacterium]